jgi:hypothetical protein
MSFEVVDVKNNFYSFHGGTHDAITLVSSQAVDSEIDKFTDTDICALICFIGAVYQWRPTSLEDQVRQSFATTTRVGGVVRY